MAQKFVSISLLLVSLLAAACGTVALPAWSEQAQGTEAAIAATTEHLTAIAPTDTPTMLPATATLIPSATPIPPTVTPTSVPPTETPIPPTATTDSMAGMNMGGGSSTGALPGDPEHGKVLFNTVYEQTNFACATCHFPDKEDRLIGPGLKGVSVHGPMHAPGNMTAEDYIRQSIVNPSAYVVPDFPDGLMPQIWGQVFTEQEINDLIAYLMTL